MEAELRKKTVRQLKEIAKKNGLRRYSSLRKEALIQKILRETLQIGAGIDNGENVLKRLEKIKNRIRGGGEIPETIAGYKILKRLGSGSFGTTYLGTKQGRKVTIKEFKSPLKEKRLKQELLALKQVQPCRGVPKYRSIYVNKRTKKVYLITYYVEGYPLKEYIRNVKNGNTVVSAEDLNNIMKDLTKTLSCIHRRGYIHRDIKGNNIIIDTKPKKPKVTLIDFGLSCLYDEDLDVRFQGTVCQSQKGGNRKYYPKEAFQLDLPPETYLDLDMYALGALFLNLTTGNNYSARSIPKNPQTGSRTLNAILRRMFSRGYRDDYNDLEEVYQNLRSLTPNERYRILSRS